MSAATLLANNHQTSPHKRRTKPLSTASSYSYTDKPKSGSGISGQNLRDTSVNVAGAFTQAVQDFTMSSRQANGYTTALPNGNGVYDSRGIGAPPPSRSRKPLSRASRGRAPEESDDDVDGARLRGKSPLLEAASSFVRALSPGGSLYLRQKAGGDEEPSGYQSLTGAFAGIKPNSSHRGGGAPLSNVSSDYNYSREESLMNKMDPPSKPASAALKKKVAPRPSGSNIDVDKQAYKPPVDEEEDDDDEWSEDERGHRRKRAKGGPAQKKLNNLPTVGAHAKHRRGPRRKKANGDDGSETDTPGPQRESVGRSLRGSVPPRGEDTTWQDSYDQNEHFADEYAIADSQAHPSESAFSIGGLLGRLVNMGYHLVAEAIKLAIGAATMLSVLAIRLIGAVFDTLLIKPVSWISSGSQKLFGAVDWSNVAKGIFLLLALWVFINSLMVQSHSSDSGWGIWPPRMPSRNPPPIVWDETNSNGALLDLARRLQEMENRIIDIQFAQRRAFDRLDSQSRLTEESMKKIDSLDAAVSKQNQARLESEEKLRSSNAASVSSLRAEISNMMSQINSNNNAGSNSVPDERILILERRLQAAEAGVKDAVEASKQAVASASKVVTAPSGTGDSAGTRWLGKISGTDGKALTIKSSDGRDVTSLIGTLVDNAVSKWTKDDIALPDYASYFAGGRVIPQLTSQTYKIVTPSSWGSWGWFGSTSTEGRPPVTALHPDIHVGNCWPFKGSQGQIGVMLARSVIITDVTIDHAAKEVAFDVRSAPKKMELWGLVDGEENVKKVAEYHKRREQRYRDLVTAANREGRTPPLPEDPYPTTLPPDAHYLRLAQFTYDVNSHSHIQTFSVPQEIQDLGVDVGVVVLMVRSNWGDPTWTCLYRLRVAGHDLDRRPYPLDNIEEP